MVELPAGDGAFTFTDIEGSTASLKRLGDEYAAVLSSHRRLVRASLAACGGVEIDTQGDAFFAAFGRARDAVDAVTRIQSAHAAEAWPHDAEVCVRIGLHTGEPTLSDEGYLGLDVVRAARLCGAARGGQVLMSQVTRALVGSALPDGAASAARRAGAQGHRRTGDRLRADDSRAWRSHRPRPSRLLLSPRQSPWLCRGRPAGERGKTEGR